MNDRTLRFYRVGRRRYGLPAGAAVQYARDRDLVWTTSYDWYAEPDDDGDGLVLVLIDDERGDVDAVGGVDVPYSVSDHGNVLYDDDDPFLVGIVADMVRGRKEVPA